MHRMFGNNTTELPCVQEKKYCFFLLFKVNDKMCFVSDQLIDSEIHCIHTYS